MGTTAGKLQAVLDSKEDIAAAITEKGGTVPTLFKDFGNAIRALPSGGGAASPPEPLDAKKVYATLRDPSWPPMPDDIPEHTIVFLLAPGAEPNLTVICDGQYTAEMKKCALEGDVWSYEVESTEIMDSQSTYQQTVASDTQEYRFLTVSASSIIDLTFNANALGENMKGCLEVLYRLPSMRVPKLNSMPDVFFMTGLGPSGGTSAVSFSSDNPKLLCYIGSDLQISGSMIGGFANCESILAVDISVKQVAHVGGSLFSRCKSLIAIPENMIEWISTGTKCFDGCTGISSLKIDTRHTSSLALSGFCNGCINLRSVEISAKGKTILLTNSFRDCISLKRLIVNAPNWVGSSFSIEDCAFDRAGLVEMFESLPIAASGKTITITGNPGVAELSEEDKAIATGKNWTLVLE